MTSSPSPAELVTLEDRRLALIVGDVSGHGRGALPQTALARYTLRAYLEAGMPPREAVQMAAPGLARELKSTSLTVALATYDPDRRQLVYSCAGHPPPIVVGFEHEPVTACSSPPIGMGLPTGRRQTTINFPGPATVCFYTDGLADATVRDEPFGEDRLKQLIAEMGEHASAQKLVDAVASATDRQFDDMAACLFRIDGSDESVVPCTTEEIELDAVDIERRDSLERFLAACTVPEGHVESIRERATGAMRQGGTALVRVTRRGGPPVVEVSSPRVRVLDPLRASG
jgi:Stage II sporulation protein E (SpoIIE)